MMGREDRDQRRLFYEFNLDDVISEDHLLTFVALDETGADAWARAPEGRTRRPDRQFAILLRSRVKGHGLGWLLMRRAIDCAKEKGLRRVYSDVLLENTTVLQKCAELGSTRWKSEITRVVLDLQNIGDH